VRAGRQAENLPQTPDSARSIKDKQFCRLNFDGFSVVCKLNYAENKLAVFKHQITLYLIFYCKQLLNSAKNL
jgi:hypothetical protein